MHWEDAPFVKLYRDNGPWMDLSLEARGLFDELLKVVDRAGLLKLGADPVKTIARAVNGDPARVHGYLDELTRDGCVTLRDGVLVMRNYIAAQGARASDKSRQAEMRARAREMALLTGNQSLAAENVTHESRGVTHASLLEENRLDQTRLDQNTPPDSDESAGVVQPFLALVPVDPPAPKFDFVAVYREHYPRKEGKKRGLEICESDVRTASDFESWKRAVLNFASLMRAEGRAIARTKHFDSFMAVWRDYIDVAPGPSGVMDAASSDKGRSLF